MHRRLTTWAAIVIGIYASGNAGWAASTISVTPEAYVQPSDGGDFGPAFNRALKTGNKVEVGCKTYNIATTIRYQHGGQIIEGCGNGYAADIGRTILKWTGPVGGKVISFAQQAGSGGVSNAQLRDLDIDGNKRANIGVEVYDDSAANGGGNWRNSLSHVTVRDVTGGTSSRAIELGHSNRAPNFANDFVGYSVGVFNSNIGVWLNGSTEIFHNSTIGFNSGLGFRVEEGGNLQLHSCICQDNGTDISARNPGNIAILGGSFQNSRNGIIVLDKGSTQNAIGIFGAYLHTFSKVHIFDFQAAAGGVAIMGSFVPTDSASRIVAGINPTYSFTASGTTGLSLPR